MLMTMPSQAATFRSHGSLQSCIMTIGDFCPIESIGFSILGTAAIAIVLFVIGLGWRMLTAPPAQKSRPGRLPAHVSILLQYDDLKTPSPDANRFAQVKSFMAIGDYENAANAIAPFLRARDPGAQPLLNRIKAKLDDWNKRTDIAFDLMKAGEHNTAFRYVKKLADEGDSQSMFTLGILYNQGKGTPVEVIEGMKWIELASKRGEKRAIEALLEHGGRNAFPEHQVDIDQFVANWRPTTA